MSNELQEIIENKEELNKSFLTKEEKQQIQRIKKSQKKIIKKALKLALKTDIK